MPQVKIDFSEELITPLLQEHLSTGRAVASLIQDAVSFHLKCKEEISNGRSIASGKPNRTYFNDFRIIMGKEGE